MLQRTLLRPFLFGGVSFFTPGEDLKSKSTKRVILPPPSERLTQNDFLEVHDALKEIDSAYEVRAHVSPKSRSLSPYMADMTCLIPNFHGPRATEELVVQLSRRRPTWSFDFADFNIRIKLLTGEIFALNVGLPGVTLDDVLKAPTNEQRRPLRASLGCDEELFIDELADIHYRIARLMVRYAKENYADSCQPPLMYWAAHALHVVAQDAPIRFDAFEPYDMTFDGARLTEAIKKTFWMSPDAEVPCPILPPEDMNQITEIKNLRDLLRPQGLNSGTLAAIHAQKLQYLAEKRQKEDDDES